MHNSQKAKRIRYRPWLWPAYLTRPVPPGLWLLNAICQRVFGVNNEIPWMVHFTSRVLGEITIGKEVKIFCASGGCYDSNGQMADYSVFVRIKTYITIIRVII